MTWGSDGTLMVGETNRGWGSSGDRNEGFQQLVWTRRVPFEMKAVRAMSDGFEIEFTKPVDLVTASNLANYKARSFLYKYQPVYGSPPVQNQELVLKGVKISADGLRARLVEDGLRTHFIHELQLFGVLDADGKQNLVHPMAYYTLNQIPSGEKLATTEFAVQNTTVKPPVPKPKIPKEDVLKIAIWINSLPK